MMLSLAGLMAQTIVSTAVENKNVVLEEYGGIYCVYCPEGNAIAAAIGESHPDDVVLINIHEGPYANPLTGDPDFRTDFGESLATQTGLNGYPAGTINRRVFPGYEQGWPNTTAINRSYWSWAAEQMLEEVAPVNLAATASLDISTGEMSIYVEIYYTANSAASTNRLNIALLQNEVLGPQVGGGAGDEYVHNRLLRDMITGQWGEVINTTTAGHFESRTITYELPSEVRGIPIDPSKLELALFISEGHQKILNAIQIEPSFVVPYNHDGNALYASTEEVICGEWLTPTIIIRNDGHEPLTSVNINYSVNDGTPAQYTWEGNLLTFQSETIELPEINFVPNYGGTNLLEIELSNPNDSDDEGSTNNYISTTFANAPQTSSQMLEVKIRTDNYGYETYWECTDESGSIIASGGNMTVGTTNGGAQIALPSNPGAYGNNQNITEYITLPGEGCYNFRILDDYGDGICCDYGVGFYEVKPVGGTALFSGGIFTSQHIDPFEMGQFLTAVKDQTLLTETLSVYPNPAQKGEMLQVQMTLSEALTVDCSLFSLTGNEVASFGSHSLQSGEQQLSFPLPALPASVYLLQLQSEQAMQRVKVVISE